MCMYIYVLAHTTGAAAAAADVVATVLRLAAMRARRGTYWRQIGSHYAECDSAIDERAHARPRRPDAHACDVSVALSMIFMTWHSLILLLSVRVRPGS